MIGILMTHFFLPSHHLVPPKSRLAANPHFCLPLQEEFLLLSLLTTLVKSFLFFLLGWDGGDFSCI